MRDVVDRSPIAISLPTALCMLTTYQTCLEYSGNPFGLEDALQSFAALDA